MAPELHEVLSVNIIALILIICTSFFNKPLLNTNIPGLKYWRMMLPLTAVAVVCEVITFVLSGKPGALAYWTLLLCNSYCYVMSFLMTGLWLKFMTARLYRSDKTERNKLALNLYLIVSAGLVAVNIFFPIFFRFNEGHVYERVMPGFIIAAVVPAGALIFSLVDYFIFMKRHHKMRFFHVEAFLAPVFLGFGLQMFSTMTSYIWVSVSIALGCMAFAVQNEVRNRDPLTGIYNRAYLEYMTAKKLVREQDHFSGIMLDINGFKCINDTMGHSAGDEALMNTAEVLEGVICNDGVVIRYAGDEFIVLLPTSDRRVVNETMEKINRAFEDYNARQKKFYITLSSGFSAFDPKSETWDVFLNRMDAAMYENKRSHYMAKGNLPKA